MKYEAYIDMIIQMYLSGSSKSAIAKKMAEEGLTEGVAVDSVRRNISRIISKVEIDQSHPGLTAEAKSVGIDPKSVDHYWYKGKHYSIHAKTSSANNLSWDQIADLVVGKMKGNEVNPINREFAIDDESHLLVIDAADIHVGKLSSSYETGEDYDDDEAVRRAEEGVFSVVESAMTYKIDHIVFVVGNDILHVDNARNTTTAGTPQDVSSMWYDSFNTAFSMYIRLLSFLSELSPVTVVYNPSNHDYTSGFFLCQALKAWFNKYDNISWDDDMKHRKYFRYHNSLIGTTHGDGAKVEDLPLLMAVESKDFTECSHRYFYTHHKHHKVAKDYIGVTIESVRSPSSADSWHHRNGYQHAPKSVEGFIHSKKRGQVARITHNF
jgi:hypothetical protein